VGDCSEGLLYFSTVLPSEQMTGADESILDGLGFGGGEGGAAPLILAAALYGAPVEFPRTT
jgi:hypothetical protein